MLGVSVGQFKIRRLETKLETYEESLAYLTEWCKKNQDISLKISDWLSSNTYNLDVKQLKTVTQYHIEISKIMYATIALLDKVYKNKERLEKWKEDLSNVQ